MEALPAALGPLLHYRYAALFAYVFATQCGLPAPATPVLVVTGALVASGRFDLAPTLATAVLACVMADSSWYALGRTRGNAVVRLLCRISMEPVACVRKAGTAIARYGGPFLLVAKFLPGVGLMASPSAGQSGMRYLKFAAFDTGGAMVWVGTYVALGRLLGQSIVGRGVLTVSMGLAAAVVIGSAVAFLASRIVLRYRVPGRFVGARITVLELSRRIARGDQPSIVDLRGRGSLAQDRLSLPGAIQLTMDELFVRIQALPRDREIVLVCDCPGDAASTLAAGRLRRMGFDRALPLEGGVEAWKNGGLPLVESPAQSSAACR
jgi:membrane protein DedA with SNARE-associated domain/rhodanese-related sulfurtransferase